MYSPIPIVRYTYHDVMSKVPGDRSWADPVPRMNDGNDRDRRNAVSQQGAFRVWKPYPSHVRTRLLDDEHSACTSMAPICQYPKGDVTFEGGTPSRKLLRRCGE